MLKYRLIFGPIMIAALLAIFYVDDALDRVSIEGTALQTLFDGRTYLPAGLVMLVAFLALIVLGSREMTQIFRAKGIDADRSMVAASGIVGCLLMYAVPYRLAAVHTMTAIATIACVLFLGTLMRYAARRRSEGAVAVAGVSMFSLIYLGLLPGFYIVIRRWHSAWLIAGIMLITKSCDIGAYFTGRFLGKHKLIPWLSPGKTWEGFIGGILTSGIVAMGLSWLGTRTGVIGTWVNPEPGVREWEVFAYPWWFALCFGILAGIVGQLGDLTASLFKRDAGIKDSGSAIPGFGGVLDVVDSPLVVAPLAYWLLVLGRELAVPA